MTTFYSCAEGSNGLHFHKIICFVKTNLKSSNFWIKLYFILIAAFFIPTKLCYARIFESNKSSLSEKIKVAVSNITVEPECITFIKELLSNFEKEISEIRFYSAIKRETFSAYPIEIEAEVKQNALETFFKTISTVLKGKYGFVISSIAISTTAKTDENLSPMLHIAVSGELLNGEDLEQIVRKDGHVFLNSLFARDIFKAGISGKNKINPTNRVWFTNFRCDHDKLMQATGLAFEITDVTSFCRNLVSIDQFSELFICQLSRNVLFGKPIWLFDLTAKAEDKQKDNNICLEFLNAVDMIANTEKNSSIRLLTLKFLPKIQLEDKTEIPTEIGLTCAKNDLIKLLDGITGNIMPATGHYPRFITISTNAETRSSGEPLLSVTFGSLIRQGNISEEFGTTLFKGRLYPILKFINFQQKSTPEEDEAWLSNLLIDTKGKVTLTGMAINEGAINNLKERLTKQGFPNPIVTNQSSIFVSNKQILKFEINIP